jgi:PAS domain S-box-containing protein
VNNLPRVLLVDESVGDRRLAALVLRGEFGDLELEAVGTATEFSAALAAGDFGLVITEAELSWAPGLDVVQLVRQVQPECPVVLFTSASGESLWAESLRLGVDGYVSKSSDGFVRLPAAVRSVFFTTRRRAAASSRDAPYRRLLDALPVGVFTATLGGEIVEANPAFASILGLFDPEEVAWSSFAGLFAEQEAGETWKSRMETSRYVGSLTTRLRRSDGSLVWVRISSWVVEHAASGVRQIQGLIEEVGDLQERILALQERGARLERSNRELEQFAYVVSHDLQQPLSLVSSYLEMLADSARDSLSTEEESYLDRATAGALRVHEMVDAILSYSRVDSRGSEFTEVDLEEVLAEVRDALWKEITCAKAEVSHDPLPIVWADSSQMGQLLQNLLSNALKFSDSVPARVHLSAIDTDESWQISIRDDGIGIDPDAADRIFLMFQRLHTEKEYPGTGIGLAICKRIVERHGGRIWVESQPRRGATFRFTLAKRKDGS